MTCEQSSHNVSRVQDHITFRSLFSIHRQLSLKSSKRSVVSSQKAASLINLAMLESVIREHRPEKGGLNLYHTASHTLISVGCNTHWCSKQCCSPQATIVIIKNIIPVFQPSFSVASRLKIPPAVQEWVGLVWGLFFCLGMLLLHNYVH